MVVAARGEEGLATLVDQIVADGGRASPCVTDADAVMRLTADAIDQFGTFDTWVNNAGVAIAGKLDTLPDDDGRTLFDVSFWGMVHGSRPRCRT